MVPVKVIKIYYDGKLLYTIVPTRLDNLQELRETVIRNLLVVITDKD